jgi:Na+:H+ antiporter
VLNLLGWPLFATAEPGAHGAAPDLLAVVRDFADVGVILLMFVAGLETDLAEMRRVGKVAFWSAFGGVLLPMAGGMSVAVLFGLPLYWEGIFVGTILTATSVSISAQTLMELGAIRSREGATILGAAVIDDVMGIVVLSFVVAFAKASTAGVEFGYVAFVILRMAAYFAVAVAAGRFLPHVLTWAGRLPVTQAVLSAALVVALVYAWAAEYGGGVAAITGAYVAGVLLAQTSFKRQIDAGIHPLTYSIFVPLFFIGIGLQANGRDLGDRVAFTVVLVLVAIVAKAVGCGVFARISGFTATESVRVGVGMISRGEVGLIVAGYGLANGLIGQKVFSASVVMVLATTMVTPPLLRWTFPRRPFLGDATVEETVAHAPDARDSELFVAERLDRIESRGADRRDHARDNTNRGGEAEAHGERPHRQ